MRARTLVLCVTGVGFSLVPTPAEAGQLPIREASLEIQIRDVPTLEIPTDGNVDGLLVTGARTETALLGLALPAGLFAADEVTVPVSGIEFVTGIEIFDVQTGPGLFSSLAGGAVGGPMAIGGTFNVCLFVSCDDPSQTSFLDLPLDVVGQGGSVSNAGSFIEVSLTGAPWTTGSMSVGNMSESGSVAPAPGGDGYLAVRLVTPIRVETSLAAPWDLIPAFGILALEVPEPGGLARALCAFGALAMLGARRRRV